MHIYFCGIGGVGLGPLAEIARGAGHSVSGSDLAESPTFLRLRGDSSQISLDQSGAHMAAVHDQHPIDWFVYTAALPSGHPELALAGKLGIASTKRDELLKKIIEDSGQKLVAVAGTHGKTTTTAMVAWLFKQLKQPVSYLIGAPVNWGASGSYDSASSYFIYECDEFDRNFLAFHPSLSLIVSLGYDHPDTYPTQASYDDAFEQFRLQSQQTISWNQISPDSVSLPGQHNRSNGALAVEAVARLTGEPADKLAALLKTFPGTARRFEKLSDNIYSDYAHHPDEISATLEMAGELSEQVVAVYQPHQNIRQHSLGYTDCFNGAEKVYWLPTYLSREDPALPLLNPQDLTKNLQQKNVIYSDLDEKLWQAVLNERQAGKLVLLMGAGSIDSWARDHLA